VEAVSSRRRWGGGGDGLSVGDGRGGSVRIDWEGSTLGYGPFPKFGHARLVGAKEIHETTPPLHCAFRACVVIEQHTKFTVVPLTARSRVLGQKRRQITWPTMAD